MSRFFETRERKIQYETIELYHPAIGTLRYVNKQFNDKQFTLEADAPRNAGQSVTFVAAAFALQKPSISEDGVLSMQVQLGRVGSMMKQYQKQIKSYNLANPNTAQVEFIYREYQDSTLYGKIPMWIGNISIDGDNVQLTASDDNPNAIGLADLYLPQYFVGLKVLE